ncbi:MAG: hypothetical protein HZA13_09090 [Nitrospirae bacterium]|nr:hypothetical protein [Nitrospirota bacterium]
MKIGRLFGVLAVTLFLLGIAISAYAAKGPVETPLDSYGINYGGVASEIPNSDYMGQEEFAWTPNTSAKGWAVIAENEHGRQDIRIEAKGLPGNCEFMAYLVDPENMKVYGLGDKDYTFRTDSNGNGNFSFTTPIQSAYDALPMTDLADWSWKSIDIQMKPGCVGSLDTNLKVLALDLERIEK